MENSQNYLAVNKQSWNQRVHLHLESDFYDMPNFLAGKSSLNDIELNLLGNLAGKKVLHLQCHFGQDSISLAKLGAAVTGVDLSDEAIQEAQRLAQQIGVDARFICCDIYDLPNHLQDQFDYVFSSYGTITWLPDLDKWAQIIAQFLKPEGKFVFAEFHPVVWMFDDNFEHIAYRYFQSEAIVELNEGSYAAQDAAVQLESVTWNHSLSEVIGSLIKQGLQIESFDEFDYSPYDCFHNTVEVAPRKYRIKHLENKIPMVYALVAQKKP